MRDDEDEEILAESKKPLVFPSRRGTSNGVNIPKEILNEWNRGKTRRQCLVKIYLKRGKDGKLKIEIARVKVE